MKNKAFSKDYSAASEVIGAILLVLIAIGAFGAIYFQVFPIQLPGPEPHVLIAGYMSYNNTVVLEHIGGEEIIDYQIITAQSGKINYDTYRNDPWEIGLCKPANMTDLNRTNPVKVTVVDIMRDGSTHIVFDGIITPKEMSSGESPGESYSNNSMLVSTLRKNTPDEDLICYTYPITPKIQPKTFIYSWMVATTGFFQPLTRLLLPFDTQSTFNIVDYSGNHNNGTITGATWTAAGKLGGAYQFNGFQFITIPYCFQNNKIDRITVEVWVKTNENSGTILSYNRSNYWELAVSDGRVKWSTNASDGIVDVKGTTVINDSTWHLVAVTYNSTLGDCAIYVDGRLDVYQHVHGAEKFLGSGNNPPGAIGKGAGISSRQTIFSTGFETQAEKNQWREQNSTGSQETWVTLRYDNFNTNFGSYTDGGSDCYLDSTNKHEGTQSACIRDNSGDYSSFYLTNGLDVDTPSYKSIKVDFWWMWDGSGWSNGEDWWLLYYNGGSWVNIVDMIYPSGYAKKTWYHSVVYINESKYIFPTHMKIRFQCDASDNYDLVYIDQVYINATSYGRIEGFFDLLPSTALIPHTGTYSIGGTGDFDPEYALYNRTGIDVSGYSNVQLSVWYSYKNTENSDFLGLYYLNGTHWQPIFEIHNPQVSGQANWIKVTVNVPSTITVIRLQFKWQTSSTSEYVALDDLEITGLPHGGEKNFTGYLDEVKIYTRDLSPEQLYQNYLCTRNGNSNISVFVSEELSIGEAWECIVTPNNGVQDDSPIPSNIINIINYGGG